MPNTRKRGHQRRPKKKPPIPYRIVRNFDQRIRTTPHGKHAALVAEFLDRIEAATGHRPSKHMLYRYRRLWFGPLKTTPRDPTYPECLIEEAERIQQRLQHAHPRKLIGAISILPELRARGYTAKELPTASTLNRRLRQRKAAREQG